MNQSRFINDPKNKDFNKTHDHMDHLNFFRIQILINGGSDGVHCKMFVGMLVRATL